MGGCQYGRAAYFGMDNGLCGLSGREVLIRVKTMLNQVLREIKTAKGPITVHELSRKMGVEPDAMDFFTLAVKNSSSFSSWFCG